MSPPVKIDEIGGADLDAALPGLAEVLRACVADGASVGFVAPFEIKASEAFWRDGVFPEVRNGGRVLWGAYDADRLVGTVQLSLAMMPNQVHRGEVSKMLVHPAARNRGIGAALMQRLIARAEQAGRRLITLDTRTGDAAQRLYARAGFEVAGEIPEFALAPEGTDRCDPTTYMYRLGDG